LVTDEQGRSLSEPRLASNSSEPINEIAKSRACLVVTTRSDVNLLGPSRTVVFPVGAHGVTVAPSGDFVVPMGRSGIALLRPDELRAADASVFEAKGSFTFYRALAVPADRGTNAVVCAGRHGGIGLIRARPGSATLHTLQSQDIDAIDVCPISTPDHPRGVAALFRDGTVVFIRDILHATNLQRMRIRPRYGLQAVSHANRRLGADKRRGILAQGSGRALSCGRDARRRLLNAHLDNPAGGS
jgi:hypothetical protein